MAALDAALPLSTLVVCYVCLCVFVRVLFSCDSCVGCVVCACGCGALLGTDWDNWLAGANLRTLPIFAL